MPVSRPWLWPAQGATRAGVGKVWGAWGPEARICPVFWHLWRGPAGRGLLRPAEQSDAGVPSTDFCEVVNCSIITPCSQSCANSVQVQLGPGPGTAETRQPRSPHSQTHSRGS